MRNIFWLCLLCVSHFSYAETAIERAHQYFDDLKAYKFIDAASHFDTDQLKEFRSLMEFYKEIPAEAQAHFITTFFGKDHTHHTLSELSDLEFFAGVFDFLMKQADAMGGLNFENIEILGEVPEGDNLVHLVTRNKVIMGEIELESMEVVSLKKNDHTWKVMLNSQIKGLPAQIKAAFHRSSQP